MSKKRTPGYDHLRAAACIAIIFLHTFFSTTLMYPDSLSERQSLGYSIFMNELMWAVPCFIMVTGALLLPPEKEISYKQLFGKYIVRILKAIVLFCAVYTAAEMIFDPSRRTASYFLSGLYKIITGKSWSHMWYLYCLAGLYLLLPLFKAFTEKAEEKDIRYVLIVFAVFQSLVPLLEAFGFQCGFYIHFSTVYPFWLFLGYYISRWGSGISRHLYAGLFLAATALLIAATVIRFQTDIAGLDALFEYSSVLVILQAAGIAGWLFGARDISTSAVGRILHSVDYHSFGIYLIHMMFVRLIYKHLHFDPFSGGLGTFGVIGTALAAFLLSYICTWVLKKISFFRKIL